MCLVNRQDHNDKGITTIDSFKGYILRTCATENNTIPSVGQLARANTSHIRYRVSWIYSKRHRNHRVAAIGSLQGHRLRTSNVEDDAVPGVGQFALTDGLLIVHSVSRIDGQSHRHDGVAAIGSLQGHRLRTSNVEDDAVPGVGQFALTDGLLIVHSVSRIDGQSHRHDGVAAIGSLQGHRLRTSNVEVDTIPGDGQFALTDGLLIVHSIGRVDSQSHGHHRVATVSSLQGYRLCASLSKLNTIPGVG